MSMISICVILLISTYYHSYAIAGQISAVSVVSYAVVVSYLSRLVDKYGQRKIVLPSIFISVLTLIMRVFSIIFVFSPWVLCLLLFFMEVVVGLNLYGKCYSLAFSCWGCSYFT